MSEIYYSAVEDDWSSSDEAIEEVAQQKWDDLTDDERPEDRVIELYKGVKEPQKFANFLNVDRIVDDMGEVAYDECGEWAEDYLDDVTEDQKNELEALICQWADKHGLKPTWFMIENIETIKFTVPNDWD